MGAAMSEYVGLQAIATAVGAGVTYNELWVAVRTAIVTLRVAPELSNEPYVANDDEVRVIHSRLRPECAPPRHVAPAPEQPQELPAENSDSGDPLLVSLHRSVKMLEQRCEQKYSAPKPFEE